MALLSLSQSSFSAAVCGLSLLHRLYVAVFGGGGSFASARKEEQHVGVYVKSRALVGNSPTLVGQKPNCFVT